MDFKLFILLAVTVVGSWAAPGIIDGQIAIPGQFPYQAAIFVKSSGPIAICSGVIVSSKAVLTVAQCVYDSTNKNATDVANVQVLVHSEDNTKGTKLNATKIIIHSDYNPENRVADLAIIHIDTDSLYKNSKDSSIELAPNSTSPDTVLISGWGNDADNKPNVQLQYTTLSLSTSDTCKGYFSKMNNNTMCYQPTSTGTTCNEDLGDPIVSYDRLIGLAVQEGDCTDATKPTVFQEVYSYADWVSANNAAGSCQLGLAAILFLIFSIVRLY